MKTDDQLRPRDLRCLQLLPRNYRHAIVDLLWRLTIESLVRALPGRPQPGDDAPFLGPGSRCGQRHLSERDNVEDAALHMAGPVLWELDVWCFPSQNALQMVFKREMG